MNTKVLIYICVLSFFFNACVDPVDEFDSKSLSDDFIPAIETNEALVISDDSIRLNSSILTKGYNLKTFFVISEEEDFKSGNDTIYSIFGDTKNDLRFDGFQSSEIELEYNKYFNKPRMIPRTNYFYKAVARYSDSEGVFQFVSGGIKSFRSIGNTTPLEETVTILAPSDQTDVFQRFTFSFRPIEEAVSYKILYSQDPSLFEDDIQNTTVIELGRNTLDNGIFNTDVYLESLGTYYWKVIATNDSRSTTETETFSFNVTTPTNPDILIDQPIDNNRLFFINNIGSGPAPLILLDVDDVTNNNITNEATRYARCQYSDSNSNQDLVLLLSSESSNNPNIIIPTTIQEYPEFLEVRGRIAVPSEIKEVSIFNVSTQEYISSSPRKGVFFEIPRDYYYFEKNNVYDISFVLEATEPVNNSGIATCKISTSTTTEDGGRAIPNSTLEEVYENRRFDLFTGTGTCAADPNGVDCSLIYFTDAIRDRDIAGGRNLEHLEVFAYDENDQINAVKHYAFSPSRTKNGENIRINNSEKTNDLDIVRVEMKAYYRSSDTGNRPSFHTISIPVE